MDSLKWLPSNAPLKPVGLIADNEVTTVRRMLEVDRERLRSLRGSYSEKSIILLGPEELLPWIPNALYLGQLEATPNVLIPTHLLPNVPVDWLGRAVRRKFGNGQYAIDPKHYCVYNISGAMNLSLNKLTESLNGAS